MNLYLIRHTRPAIAPGVCYGRLDVALAPESEADIERTLAAIPSISAVWSSTLERCLGLARLLAARQRVPLMRDERLVELSFGKWEGKRWDEIDRSQSERWAQNFWDMPPPGGETTTALYARVADVISEIQRSGRESVAVVSHGGPIRAALSVCLGINPQRFAETTIDYGAVITLTNHHGSWAPVGPLHIAR